MGEFSKLSDEELTDNLGRVDWELTPLRKGFFDEAPSTDSQEAKSLYEQYLSLKEEYRQRDFIPNSTVLDARIRNLKSYMDARYKEMERVGTYDRSDVWTKALKKRLSGLEDTRSSIENVAWLIIRLKGLNGINIAKSYAKSVDILAERQGDIRIDKLVEILRPENIYDICDSFRNPVFLNWLHEDRLPAYSWSASSGEEMMKALTTGDYRATYDSEKKLIDRVNREIYSKHPLGK